MAVLLHAKLLAYSLNQYRDDYVKLEDDSLDFSPILYHHYRDGSFITNGKTPQSIEFIHLDRNYAALAALFTETVCAELVRIMHTPDLWRNFNGLVFWEENIVKNWTCASLYKETLTPSRREQFDQFLTKIDSSILTTKFDSDRAIFDNVTTLGDAEYIKDNFYVTIEELEKIGLRSTKVFTIGDSDLIGDCSNLVLDYIGGNDFLLFEISN